MAHCDLHEAYGTLQELTCTYLPRTAAHLPGMQEGYGIWVQVPGDLGLATHFSAERSPV